MKKYKDLNLYDFSGYAEEITGDALFKVGGSLSVGIVLNPNNYWDSGIIGSIGIGTGVEVGINVPLTKPLSTIVENTISVAASCVDFSSPKSTQDLEGSHNTAYASALFGIAHDLDTNRISGIEELNNILELINLLVI